MQKSMVYAELVAISLSYPKSKQPETIFAKT